MEKSPELELLFHGANRDLLARDVRNKPVLSYRLARRASIKDIIESLGVPHTEVGRITMGGKELNFTFIPVGAERLNVYPFTSDIPPTIPTLLRPHPFEELRFLVDDNVRKLGRLLRMAGIDAEPVTSKALQDVADTASKSQRIVLSRNRDLLRMKEIVFGRLLRNEDPFQQFRDIFTLYALAEYVDPFTRCMCCNGILEQVDKDTVLGELEPLTKKYYNRFKRCCRCSRIYWKGSHHLRMEKTLSQLIGKQPCQLV